MRTCSQIAIGDKQANCPLSSTDENTTPCMREKCPAFMESVEMCVYVKGAAIGLRLIRTENRPALPVSSNREFQGLYAKHYDRVFRVAYRMLRSWEMAEEITQEAFIKVYTNFDSITADMPLSGWLYRVVTNLCLDELRRQKLHKIEPCAEFEIEKAHRQFMDCKTISPEKIFDRQEDRMLIDKVLMSLPSHYYQVLVMRCIDKLSYEDIAYTMDVTIASIRSMIFRARRQFIERYKELTESSIPVGY